MLCPCVQDDGASSQGGRSAGGDDEEELVLSRVGCFLWLTGVTVFISFLSEFVTDAIRVGRGRLGTRPEGSGSRPKPQAGAHDPSGRTGVSHR